MKKGIEDTKAKIIASEQKEKAERSISKENHFGVCKQPMFCNLDSHTCHELKIKVYFPRRESYT